VKNSNTKTIWEATLTDWCIVLYPEIDINIETPEAVFAKLNSTHQVALFGKAKNDPRKNVDTGEFEDGHRIISSPILTAKDGKYHTMDTIYELYEEEKNTKFDKWCKENQYKEISLSDVTEEDEKRGNMILRHICESCGKEQILSSKEGFNQGWDYPPEMGKFGIISPRKCGECGIKTTLWWEILINKTPIEQLSEWHQETLKRILAEPESILP